MCQGVIGQDFGLFQSRDDFSLSLILVVDSVLDIRFDGTVHHALHRKRGHCVVCRCCITEISAELLFVAWC